MYLPFDALIGVTLKLLDFQSNKKIFYESVQISTLLLLLFTSCFPLNDLSSYLNI